MCSLHAGITDTSAVTMLFTPRFESPPLTRPHVKAKYWKTKNIKNIKITSNNTVNPNTAVFKEKHLISGEAGKIFWKQITLLFKRCTERISENTSRSTLYKLLCYLL